MLILQRTYYTSHAKRLSAEADLARDCFIQQ